MKLYCTLAFLTALACGHCSARSLTGIPYLHKQYKEIPAPLQKVFDDACQRGPADYWIWDGIHPTYSGHQLMADEWARVALGEGK
jgi:lysophospholipase L1-like esterase